MSYTFYMARTTALHLLLYLSPVLLFGLSDTPTGGVVVNSSDSKTEELENSEVAIHFYENRAVSAWEYLTILTIEGTVYEDVNYGGGLGRDFNIANTEAQASGWSNLDVGVENARVELYDNLGAFVSSTSTDVNGAYQFNNLLPGDYQVRFATRTVSSNRGSNASGDTPFAVPSYRNDGTATFANEVGGTDPTKEDAGSNTTSQNISALTTGTTVAQAVTTVTLTSASISNVDLGLNFNVVSNTNSSGIGSVRQFIINANELSNVNLDQEDNPVSRPALVKEPGTDVSVFEIAGVGPHEVLLATELPSIDDPFTHLTGYTQKGSVQEQPRLRTINVRLYSTSGGFDGVSIRASNVSVSGVSLGGFVKAIYSGRSGVINSFIWGNFVGLESDGLTGDVNTSLGVSLDYQEFAVVGSNGDGINDLNEGNVLANSYEGINVRRSTGTTISGNYIGLDRTGETPAGNRFLGVSFRDCPGRNVVGLDDQISTFTPDAARNIIGGNGTDGVRVSGSEYQVIAGNYIGTDRFGTSAVRNSGYGVQFIGDVSYTQLGTNSNGQRDVEERNIISGNLAGFRSITGGTGTNNWIANNYIGVDVTGLVALENENNGMSIIGSQTNTIIGNNADGIRDELERNVISGNRDDAIRIGGLGGNRVSGNYIGVGSDGTTPVPNGGRGVFITSTSSDNIIGASASYTNTDHTQVGNLIRGNGDTGIGLSGTGSNNRLSKNTYGDNNNLAIDLEYNLVTPNTTNSNGPNDLLNFPVITYSKLTASVLRIEGFAPAGVTVEFYIADGGVNPSPLPTGYTSSFGEGYEYLAEAQEGGPQDNSAQIGTYMNDGTGATTVKTENQFSFDIPLASLLSPIALGAELTAISISASGSTSEFSGRASVTFVEICDDAIDNDGDGLIDCADEECPGANAVSRIMN